jgi:hypothetical protein
MTTENTIEESWQEVIDFMKERFGQESDLRSVLFVMGMRELGQKRKKFTKEQKQDLMNLALCKALSFDGYFEVTHLDGEGWPVWKQVKPMPELKPAEQEEFIKKYVVRYFQDEGLI